MQRYFIEVSYKGTNYSGFQVQENALTIQSEVEKAFYTLHRYPVALTGSSRTDAGVHAVQNFFHFDTEKNVYPQAVYKLNAILPPDIVVLNIRSMPAEAHSRFDAISREYVYKIHRFKNPFLQNASLYYPYTIDIALLKECADLVKTQTNFYAFSKTNTQVKNFNCTILESEWIEDGDFLQYTIRGNRFLRGMVRLITATILKVSRGKMTFKDFENLFDTQRKSGHSVPAYALYLKRIEYPSNFFS